MKVLLLSNHNGQVTGENKSAYLYDVEPDITKGVLLSLNEEQKGAGRIGTDISELAQSIEKAGFAISYISKGKLSSYNVAALHYDTISGNY